MTTPILDLDEWEESQEQPQPTVNTALRWLECFATLSAFSKSTGAPPPSPADGAVYLVPASGTSGVFIGQENKVALYISNAFAFKTPPPGTIAYVQDEDGHFKYLGNDSPASWAPL